ncbi:hypothetical protein [Proteocatella sphenisci]|uniref:hypothetical protein n=1 Tax=Proteocatella sphenisci TaxID=181070 RepID=UPI000490EB48|nr:hypothetical protein [Proteocatella sphenisci]
MKKVIRLSIMTMFIFIAFTAMSFAAPADSISADTVEKLSESFNSDRSVINKPKDFVLATIDDNVIISGMGKEGDKISISLYTRVDDEYVPIKDSIEVKLGRIGDFMEKISLKYQTSRMPVESKISKDTLVVLTLKRGDSFLRDYRVIKASDEKDLQKSLSTLRTTGFSTFSASSAVKP